MVCEISMWQTKQRNDTHKTRKLPYLIDRLISPGVNMTIIPSVNMILMMKFNCEKNDFKF